MNFHNLNFSPFSRILIRYLLSLQYIASLYDYLLFNAEKSEIPYIVEEI